MEVQRHLLNATPDWKTLTGMEEGAPAKKGALGQSAAGACGLPEELDCQWPRHPRHHQDQENHPGPRLQSHNGIRGRHR